jgi:hypothetical protein
MNQRHDNLDDGKEPKSIEQIMAENNLTQINSIMGFLFSPSVLTPAPFSTSTSNIPNNEKTTDQNCLN